MERKFSLIVACTEKGVIGDDNEIPWYLPEDLKRFKNITMGHDVIMGSKTHLSIGRSLPGRRNIVMTSGHTELPDNIGLVKAKGVVDVLELTKDSEEPFIIGGESIYNEFLKFDLIDKIHLTIVKGDYDGNKRFPVGVIKKKNGWNCELIDDFETHSNYVCEKN